MSIVEHAITDRDAWLELRRGNVNASEIACLFGDSVHQYLTAYRLWAIKSGLVPEDPDSPEKRRGRLLEPVAIQLLMEERPDWRCWTPNVYRYDEQARMGATPDVYAERYSELGVVQVKTAGKFAFAKNWVDPDTREVTTPLGIKVQASVEAHLAGAEWAAVAVMTVGDGGLGFYVEDIPLYPGLIDNAKAHVKEFWNRVALKEPYPVDYFRDRDTILDVYRDDDGSTVDFTGEQRVVDLLRSRWDLGEAERIGEEAHKARRLIDAQLISLMGNAAWARVGRTLIGAKTVKRKAYSVAATQYRSIRIKDDVRRQEAEESAAA